VKLRMEVVGVKELRLNLQKARDIVGGAEMADIMWHAVDRTVVLLARQNTYRQFKTTGNLANHIKAVKVNQYRVDIVVDAPHGAVHEYGGTFAITPRQRRFFWAKWRQTGDEMWRALALSQTYTIPARPYLRPAIDATKAGIAAEAATEMGNRMRKAFT